MKFIKSAIRLSKDSFFYSKGFKTAVWFTGGNLLTAAISAFSGLLYGRWIEPEILGEFNKYGILTGYMGLGIILVDGAFQRHFPYYLGKDDPEKALEIAGIAKWWYMLLVYIGLALFGILAARALIQSDIPAFFGWLVQIPAYAVATYGLYLKILYRSNSDFLKLNKNLLMTSVMGIFSLPLVYLFKFTGLAIRSILQNVSNITVHVVNAPYKVKAKFDFKGLIDLAKVSLPLQIPVYLDSHLLKATISLIILSSLGEESLGLYGMAIMLQGFLLVFSRSLNQIFTTKTMLNYGKHDNLGQTFNYIIKPTVLATVVGLFIVILFNITVPFAVNQFLPKYAASIQVVQILAFELVFALARSPFTLFISALMYHEMIWLRIIKAILTLFLAYLWRESLVGISASIMAAELIYLIGGYTVLRLKIKGYLKK